MRQYVLASATRLGEAAFRAETPLGRSLPLLRRIAPDIEEDIAFSNREGLSIVYNRVLGRHVGRAGAAVIFVHDDVYLNDLFLFEKLEEGFLSYDLIGIAGATQLDLARPNVGWCECPAPCRAGGVVHPVADRKDGSFYHVFFGTAPRACLVVDGVFMAVRIGALDGLCFDEQFTTDFYDLDFCLGLHARGRRIGVLPILLTHLSLGAGFGGAAFRSQQERFLAKHLPAAPASPDRWGHLLARMGFPRSTGGRVIALS